MIEDVLLGMVKHLRALDDAGTQVLADGALLIRRNPPRSDGLFQLGYYHSVFAAVEIPASGAFAELYSALPRQAQLLYQQCNVFSLFCDSLLFHGFPQENVLGGYGKNAVSILHGNRFDMPTMVPGGVDVARHQRLGSYAKGDGGDVRCSDSGEVILLPRNRNGPILYRWESVEAFIESELVRLTQAFKARNCTVSPLDVLDAPVAL